MCGVIGLLSIWAIWYELGVDSHQKVSGRGFGDDYDWRTLMDAFYEAKDFNRPILVLIFRDDCPVCGYLRPKFAENQRIKDLSGQFVMVNLENSTDPEVNNYNVDGTYVPRIYFLNSHGQTVEEIYNFNGLDEFKYFYNTGDSVADAMEVMIKYHEGKPWRRERNARNANAPEKKKPPHPFERPTTL